MGLYEAQLSYGGMRQHEVVEIPDEVLPFHQAKINQGWLKPYVDPAEASRARPARLAVPVDVPQPPETPPEATEVPDFPEGADPGIPGTHAGTDQ